MIEIKNEINQWMKKEFRTFNDIFISNVVSVDFYEKLTDEEESKINNHFNTNIGLEKVSYTNDLKNFSYKFDYYKLYEIQNNIIRWFEKHDISISVLPFLNSIIINSYKNISDSIIKEFEKDFNMKFESYEISCNLKRKSYKFVL